MSIPCDPRNPAHTSLSRNGNQYRRTLTALPPCVTSRPPLLHPPLRPGRIALLRERRPVDARCPCCDGLLEETAAAEASVDLSDARPGDRWCPNCAWLLLREALT